MKKVQIAILAVCLGALGSLMVQAQSGNVANTAYGTGALTSNTTGSYNTANGDVALHQNTTGSSNTSVGMQSLYMNTTGDFNTAIGGNALAHNVTSSYNTAVGFNTLNYAPGNNNIAIGNASGSSISGSNNIAIGNPGTFLENGAIHIGTAGTQTTFYAAGISGVQISEGVPVYINSNGQLGTVNSSIRFKEDVHDMADASDRLFQLRPVTYRYKTVYADGSKPVDYGLIAEEVAEVYPDLVARDADGEILTVQYQKLTPMLLNELQKQHRQLEAQQQTIDMLLKRLSVREVALDPGKSKNQLASK